MDDGEKLRILLPHWIEHNRDHGREFAKWASIARSAGQVETAELLERAAASLREADAALREALSRTGGALHGRGEHHGHHNLPE